MDKHDPGFQRDAAEAADAFREVFKKMEEQLPTKAVLSGMAACVAERGITLRPDDVHAALAATNMMDMVAIYCAQIVSTLENEDD